MLLLFLYYLIKNILSIVEGGYYFFTIIVMMVGMCKTYRKICGKWWVPWIPIYGTYILNTKVQKRNSWLILISVINVFGWVLTLIIGMSISILEMNSEIDIATSMTMFLENLMIIIFILSIINFLYEVFLTNGISKGFGRGKWFTCGLVLMPFIFYPVLGFSKDEFDKSVFEKK